MRFSIIIPTYNRAFTITRAIDSCLAQTYKNFEIIVVDDGSTDGTLEILNPYQKAGLITYLYIENSERGFARNCGIKKSTGDYVTFLDSDDIYYENYLQHAYDIIQNEGPAFFHQAFEMVDENLKLLRKSKKNIPDDLLSGNFMACIGVFTKRALLTEFMFHEERTLAGSEDYELWLRIYAKAGLKVYHTVTSAIVMHTQRSEFNINPDKLALRINLLIKLIRKYDLFNKTQKRRIISNIYMYYAISLLETGYSLNSIKKFMMAIKENFSILQSRKTLAYVYNLIKKTITKYFIRQPYES